MGFIAWFSILKFNWLRRCKTCGVRGSDCLCRRPSLALERIFFLEERKNKCGTDNFSHVSDTVMTSSSTMFSNSTTSTVPPSNNLTMVVMRGAGSFTDSDVSPADYYYESASMAFSAVDCNGELMAPRIDNKNETQLCASGRCQRIRSSNSNAATDGSSGTIVCKSSRRMMPKARRHNGDPNVQPSVKEVVTGEYILYTEEDIPVSLSHHRQQQQQILPRNRRQLRSRNKRVTLAKTCSQLKDEPGVSFQFYGRSGCVVPTPLLPGPMFSNRSMRISSCSTNDSFMASQSSVSTISQHSDRVSIENNFGSLNLRPNLSNTGRLIENRRTLRIKEDDEAKALEKLTCWFHASSISTQDSFLLMR